MDAVTRLYQPAPLPLFIRRDVPRLLFAYAALLGVMAYLGAWTPDYLAGRDLWHFMIARMAVPIVMLGVLAAFIRLVPAALLLGAILVLIGTISAIKRHAIGEPVQISDLFLAAQTPSLLGYVMWRDWLAGAMVIPAAIHALRNARVRLWSLPLAATCAALLTTYRIEPVATWMHDNSYWIGIEELTYSQAESERMNGLATHLYFSTAGLRLTSYSAADIKAAMDRLDAGPVPPARTAANPDIYIVLGEAWWRDPSDKQSPLNTLTKAGFAEGAAISPVYGGTTPNAEFEVLTGVPVKSFKAGIIPYQHYFNYFSWSSRTLPRLLSGLGYQARAHHNFERHYWLRDMIYPRFGFSSYSAMDAMELTRQRNGWPKDDGLFAWVLGRPVEKAPQMHFIVTMQTHGPYKEDPARDRIDGASHSGVTDYRARLSGAVDSLMAFNSKLKARGRPYVLFVFGDHLPGLRQHQSEIGWTSESDLRLREVPFLAFSNSDNVGALKKRLEFRPLACVAPVMISWLRLNITDPYMRHMSQVCDKGTAIPYRPPDAVIQNQLFSMQDS
jgi:phosphoglycerol transferase MdoB-like AlkP superfamily enzyme